MKLSKRANIIFKIFFTAFFSAFICFKLHAQEHIFLDEMPYKFQFNISEEDSLVQANFKLDTLIYTPSHDDRLWMCDDTYAYFSKANGKLETLKIWETPASWQAADVSANMTEEELTRILENLKLPFEKKNSKYDRYVFMERKKLRYEFCFPKEDYSSEVYTQYAGKLHYVVVRIIDKSDRPSRGKDASY